MNHPLLIALSALILVGGLTAAIWFAVPGGSLERMRRHGAKRGLPVLPEEDERAVARAQRRAAAILIPVIVIIVPLSAAIAIALDVEASGVPQLVLLVPLITVMAVVSAFWAASQRVFTPPADAPRLARPEWPRVSALLGIGPTRVSQIAVIAAALVTVVCLGLAIARAVPAAIIVVAVLGAGAAATVAILYLAERSVLARPRPVSSAAQLTWDEAMRADAVSLVRMAMTEIALVVVLGAPAAVIASADSATGNAVVSMLLSLTFAAVMLTQAYFTWRNDTHRRHAPVIAGV